MPRFNAFPARPAAELGRSRDRFPETDGFPNQKFGERRWRIEADTRAAKRIGDFGQGLVTYALIRKGFQVACVDDIGADLIAAGRGQRYAVSVKARLFRPGSRESRGTVIEKDHLRKLGVFADRFGMVPLLAQAVCLADDAAIHLFLFRARQMADVLPAAKNGFSIRFGPGHLAALAAHPAVDYSCWREELVAGSWFGEAEVAAPNYTLHEGQKTIF